MKHIIGIRREDKNEWETRVPLIPEDLQQLGRKHNIEFVVQPSPIRIFTDDEYRQAGAAVAEDLSSCSTVLAVKEIPKELFQKGTTYIFFSHTIKGQEYNMPMLKRMMELGCHLVDYERIVDEQGRRLIFFGSYAGYAGMIDTLWSLGQRLKWEGSANPFEAVHHTYTYKNLEEAKQALEALGANIRKNGLLAGITPLIIGFAGYGNVSTAAQEIVDLLPTLEISPDEVADIFHTKKGDNNHIYKVVFTEQDMVRPKNADTPFELQDYYDRPEKYVSGMEAYLPYVGVLVNACYWESKYPRILTKAHAKAMYAPGKSPVLKVIGDISCDIEGAIECTVDSTKPDKPAFVYDPATGQHLLGVEGDGPVIMAVDNLPCELARESSSAFSHVLQGLIPEIMPADFTKPLDESGLPEPVKHAMIVYHGKLTEDYQYLGEFLR